MSKNKNKKGFTIIELIVIMAIIGVLVLLSVPKINGYTQKAKFTRLISNINQLEKASERYYIDKNQWPKLTDEPYTAEELELYAQEIYDKTGKTIILDSNGKYYNVDYNKLKKYIQEPKDGLKYIIQNPIGDVFYIDGLTVEGEEYFEKLKQEYTNNNELKEKEDNTPIVFSGLSPEAFDKNPATRHSAIDTDEVTWTGNLDNKALNINITSGGQSSGSAMRVYFKDNNNNTLKILDLSGTYVDNLIVAKTTKAYKVIVPEGAAKMTFALSYASGYVNDIYLEDDSINPSTVKNISSTSNDSSITLNWEQFDDDYSKVAIFRNGEFIAFANGFTYTDTPLYSNQEYTYEIQAIDNSGNASKRVSYTETTTLPQIIFRGLSPEAFDKNLTTRHSVIDTDEVTWTGDLSNKALNISITSGGQSSTSHMRVYFKDDSNNTLKTLDLNGEYIDYLMVAKTTKAYKIIVPEGATKMTFLLNYASGFVNDIYVEDDLISPKEVNNVSSISTDSSITLEWKQTDNDYNKAAIFRDGEFVGFSNGLSYTDGPLYADQQYSYEIIAIDNNGNASKKTSYTTKTNVPQIIFRGLSPAAFDKNSTTRHLVSASDTIIWTGDLTNKALNINISAGGSSSGSGMRVYFKDASNNTLKTLDLSGTYIDNVLVGKTTKGFKVVVPEGAVKMTFTLHYATGYVNDIYVEDDLLNPQEVTSVTSTSTVSTVSLNWAQSDSDYSKIAIFRNGVFLGFKTGFSFTDTGLVADTEYTYEIQAIDNSGNASEKITYTTKTSLN